MTVQQQQLTNRISQMSDEGINLMNQIINSLSPSFFIGVNDSDSPAQGEVSLVDVSKRIGIAKGRLGNTDHFDKWDDEIADMFEGVTQ